MIQKTKSACKAERKVFSRTDLLTDRITHYCPGCGHGVVHRLVAEALQELDLQGRTVGVAPVGCAVLAYDYLDIDVTEAAHGRTPAVATGIKRARPDLFVFTYQGDGDLAAIGMGEIVHAANRGENISVVFVNNGVYGMTGGEMAPTTLPGQKTATSPAGRDAADSGFPIQVCEMLATLRAPSYIARVAVNTPTAVRRAKKAILTAFRRQVDGKGFALVEVLSACPTYWRMDPVQANAAVGEGMAKTFPLGVYKDAEAQPQKDASDG